MLSIGDRSIRKSTLHYLSIEFHSIRLSGLAHGIVTKTVHKTLPRGGEGRVRGWWGWGSGGGGGRGQGGGVSRCHSIDRLLKLWLLHFTFYQGLIIGVHMPVREYTCIFKPGSTRGYQVFTWFRTQRVRVLRVTKSTWRFLSGPALTLACLFLLLWRQLIQQYFYPTTHTLQPVLYGVEISFKRLKITS